MTFYLINLKGKGKTISLYKTTKRTGFIFMPKQVISLATIDNKIASAEERLNRLVEQKKKFIAQEKTFITIG